MMRYFVIFVGILFNDYRLFVFGIHTVGPCTCDKDWGRCNEGMGEESTGCGQQRYNSIKNNNLKPKSCADRCIGNYSWKPLYQHSVNTLTKLENECFNNPTKIVQ
mmetsp:Transcript_2378/g.2938  ORF Transcript_2378/g.2938 Transcript_2378/m.2938 type:complete len:105 (-) Transcript_2378:34-348(-)